MQIFKHLLIDKTKSQILRFGDCHFVPLEFQNDNDLKLEVFDNLHLKLFNIFLILILSL